MVEDDEIARLMGFAAFGGANKRRRQRTPEQRVLAQVIPGTELDHLLACDANANAVAQERLKQGAHGIVYLASEPPDADMSHRLAALLLHESKKSEASGTDTPLLPAHSYELLDELQEQKNQCESS